MDYVAPIISAVATVILALPALILVLRNLAKVHVLVNSRLEEVKTNLELALQKIESQALLITALQSKREEDNVQKTADRNVNVV